MKKIFLIALIFSTVSLGAFARNGKGEGRRGGERSEMMKQLNLTEDQQAKLKSLNEDYKNKKKALRDQEKELNQSHRNSIDQVLTAEQKAQLKDLRAEKRKDLKRDKKDFAKNKKHKRAKDFNLDEATKNKLTTLKENFKKEKQAVELSRIAPEMQTKKIQELRDKYRADRKEIVQNFRSTTKKAKQNS